MHVLVAQMLRFLNGVKVQAVFRDPIDGRKVEGEHKFPTKKPFQWELNSNRSERCRPLCVAPAIKSPQGPGALPSILICPPVLVPTEGAFPSSMLISGYILRVARSRRSLPSLYPLPATSLRSADYPTAPPRRQVTNGRSIRYPSFLAAFILVVMTPFYRTIYYSS